MAGPRQPVQSGDGQEQVETEVLGAVDGVDAPPVREAAQLGREMVHVDTDATAWHALPRQRLTRGHRRPECMQTRGRLVLGLGDCSRSKGASRRPACTVYSTAAPMAGAPAVDAGALARATRRLLTSGTPTAAQTRPIAVCGPWHRAHPPLGVRKLAGHCGTHVKSTAGAWCQRCEGGDAAKRRQVMQCYMGRICSG